MSDDTPPELDEFGWTDEDDTRVRIMHLANGQTSLRREVHRLREVDHDIVTKLESLGDWRAETRGSLRVIQWMLGFMILALMSWGTWVTLGTMRAQAAVEHVQWRLEHRERPR